ncbi:MAG: helix-turn-helix transcriptional regulator [Hyphomonadaceae bacterium]|nr:helix-turn-helix transcriptional regulator [Hyphomonadaceae bacterium]MCA8885277.1 helix-turn-helix transcriptional regulator [Hyphomonadaceae bacterium]
MSDERAANAVDKKVGQRVRARRLEINMSQERLAELLGVTFQQVQKYEKGVNRIAVSRLLDIANALEISASRFFDGLERRGVAEDAPDYVNDALATPEGAQLIALYAGIKSPRVRRKVLDLVRAIADEDGDKR